MRALFITFNNIYDGKTGGDQCSRRNYLLLEQCGGADCMWAHKISNAASVSSILHLFYPPLSAGLAREALALLKTGKYGLVYLDSSLMGILARKIRRAFPQVHIVVFFHNVEVDYVDVRMKKGIKHLVYRCLAKRQERLSLQYAHRTIVLNERDKNRIKELYGKEASIIIPITYEDTYHEISATPENGRKTGLFVGALGRANYDGLKWFVENSGVLDRFDLLVVGKNFEKACDDFKGYPVNIIGTVDDMSRYYELADFVVAPILYGGGMKVKIAEALMYGKTVLGTSEALEGYQDEDGEVLIECNNSGQFDEALIRLIEGSAPKFNSRSRELFLERYCTDTYRAVFKRFITTID